MAYLQAPCQNGKLCNNQEINCENTGYSAIPQAEGTPLKMAKETDGVFHFTERRSAN
jgi:hypothetical protein